jgi:hypothetical protein
MWLRKDSGGTTIEHQGVQYLFPADSPLCEVPPDLGHILLNIRGADYAEVPAPTKAVQAVTAKAAAAE